MSMPTPLNSSPLFQYAQINSPSEIRLVVLRRGIWADPIQCSIQHVHLNSQPYEALSYEWGLASEDDPFISIEGQALRIRKNLYHALAHIRYEDQDRHIWIDALCINQGDLNERNHQVRMMGGIFRDAERVISWIGLPDEQSGLAMDVFDRVTGGILAASTMHLEAANGGLQLPRPFRPPTLGLLELWNSNSIPNQTLKDKVLISTAEVEAVIAWSDRSYWQRLWIVQEITLSRQLHVQCGKRTISGDDLRKVETVLQRSRYRMGPRGEVLTPRERRWTKLCTETSAFSLVPRVGTKPKYTLAQWIIQCRRSICSEPRDVVYALLGVALDGPKGVLKPDYSTSLVELYNAVLFKYSEPSKTWCSQVDVSTGTLKSTDEIRKNQAETAFKWLLAKRLGVVDDAGNVLGYQGRIFVEQLASSAEIEDYYA